MKISASIENPAVLPELLEIAEISGIYLPGERMTEPELLRAAEACRSRNKACYYAFPYVFRREARIAYEEAAERLRESGFDGWLLRSLDELGFVREQSFPGTYISDAGFYTWNWTAVSQLRKLGVQVFTAPYELNRRELAARGTQDTELVIYGRIPVMVTAQCPLREREGCGRGRREYRFTRLRDRRKACFLAENRCRFCYNVIYNSVPLWLLDQEKLFPERVRFQFTAEAPGEPAHILERFLRGERSSPGPYTRGHLTRGVE